MINIRPAAAQDSRNLFKWRNDPLTRLASISQAEVGWPDHERWFVNSLESSERHICIAEITEGLAVRAVGMCRFDLDPKREIAEVSINLNPAFRGRGLAAPVLQAALQHFLAEHSGVALEATIRLANSASERIFTSSGFSRRSADAVFGYYSR
jgi:RimJ/RimL family protein N-acetyltransferase